MKKKQATVMGMIFILIALLGIGYIVKTYIYSPKPDELIDEPAQKQELLEDDQEEEASQQVQNKNTIHKIDMSVKYRMPEGIEKRLDMKKFDKAFKKYLEENSLFTKNTIAKCPDGELVENFDLGYIAFTLQLNNYNRTKVTCAMDYDGTFSFDF